MPSVLQDLCSVGLQSGMGIGHCLGGAPVAPQRLNVIGNEADAVVGAVGFLQFGERAVEELQGACVFPPAKQDCTKVDQVIEVVVAVETDGEVAIGFCQLKFIVARMHQKAVGIIIGQDAGRIQLTFYKTLFEVFKEFDQVVVILVVVIQENQPDQCQVTVQAIDFLVVKDFSEPYFPQCSLGVVSGILSDNVGCGLVKSQVDVTRTFILWFIFLQESRGQGEILLSHTDQEEVLIILHQFVETDKVKAWFLILPDGVDDPFFIFRDQGIGHNSLIHDAEPLVKDVYINGIQLFGDPLLKVGILALVDAQGIGFGLAGMTAVVGYDF